VNLVYPEGAAPLDATEAEGLRLPHVTSREQLNTWEQENILAAEVKYFSRRRGDVLSEPFLLRLHRDMFGDVWRWAGKYRTSDKNLGVPHWDVAVKVRGLCEDAGLWVRTGTESEDAIAARFHHRLVSIHPFANGNSRHARLAADLLLVHVLGKPRFTWGRLDLIRPGTERRLYLEALRAADRRDFAPLQAFARS
jgi:Fic-DOC domain mobile mystery protein B